jgi:hypothetical protein
LAKETKNKSFVLRIDADTMDAIEKWAADEFRSTNGQILYILDQALKKAEECPNPKKHAPANNKYAPIKKTG